MKITILCVGKLKEKFYRDAVAEYAKRLSRYCSFEIIEVADEMTPDKAGEAVNELIREREAERLLSKLKSGSYVCSLEIKGKKLSSTQFADWLGNAALNGKSDIVFIIGGSLGLHKSVSERSDFSLSFSDMTFPHQLMRVILSEQIYRAYRLINNEPYHK
ncbi:MAG: 23S rRNA (pseudouridine(1915)-N(3))-methyltransferase RlmH [Lachnospiraceae bacterium]|nr:23S rRNA (pseudouridine(1915)-N(3))-methyltransferase RlmH [Lachnospiraceae bacterium]